jgi:hypothetical protein
MPSPLQVVLLPPDAPEALQQATSLVAAVLSACYVSPSTEPEASSSGPGVPQRMARCKSELQQLLALYSSAAAPSLQTLQHPLLLELLLQCLFPAAGQQAAADMQQVAVSLLALATTARQEGNGSLDR